MVKLWLTLILMGFEFFSFAQSLDTSFIKSQLDSAKFYRKTHFDKALNFVNEAVDVSLSNNRSEFYGDALFYKGVVYKWGNKPDSALQWYDSAIIVYGMVGINSKVASSYFEKYVCYRYLDNYEASISASNKAGAAYALAEDTLWVAYCLTNSGIMHYNIGQYDKALEKHFEALTLYERLKDTGSVGNSYVNIGDVYRHNLELDLAEEYFNKALVISSQSKDTISIANIYNNLGLLFYSKEKFMESIQMNYKALVLRRAIANDYGIAQSYNNIGNSFDDFGFPDSALFYYEQAITIREQLEDNEGLATTYGNIGIMLIKLQKFDLAIEKLKVSLDLARNIGIKYVEIEVLKQLSLAYESKNENKLSLEWYRAYAAVKDSVFNESKSKEIGKLEAKYEIEKTQTEEEQRIKEESRKKEEQTNRRDNLQYSSIMVSIVSLFILLLFAVPKVSTLWGDRSGVLIAEGLIFFVFLLFFEFLLVLADPYIDNWSSGEPMYKLLFNAILALMIFPLHSFFENLMKTKLAKPYN